MIAAGIDVSKHTCQVCILHSASPRSSLLNSSFSNTQQGLASIVTVLQLHKVTHVLMEATGGLEQLAHRSLEAAGFKVAVCNPVQARHFARSLGQREKTDPVDAFALARQQLALQPSPTPARPELDELRRLVTRRNQLVDLLKQERLHRLSPVALDDESYSTVETCLKKQLKAIEARIDKLIQMREELKTKSESIRSVPGVGKVGVYMLLAFLPELGTLSSRQIAKMVGVAPMKQESGQFKGKAMIQGGRSDVRNVLYMCAMVGITHNPWIKGIYEKHKERGGKHALVVCMRRLLICLNRLVKNEAKWREVED
jgi:transposase